MITMLKPTHPQWHDYCSFSATRDWLIGVALSAPPPESLRLMIPQAAPIQLQHKRPPHLLAPHSTTTSTTPSSLCPSGALNLRRSAFHIIRLGLFNSVPLRVPWAAPWFGVKTGLGRCSDPGNPPGYLLLLFWGPGKKRTKHIQQTNPRFDRSRNMACHNA